MWNFEIRKKSNKCNISLSEFSMNGKINKNNIHFEIDDYEPYSPRK